MREGVIKLAYGKAEVSVTLPVDNLEIVKPKKVNLAQSQKELVLQAINNPINSPPLKEVVRKGEKVCILVNDITRLTKSETFLPVLLEELNQIGVADNKISILFTNGLHRRMTKEEHRLIVGNDIAGKVKMYDHSARESKCLYVGKTSFGNKVYLNKMILEADRIIMTGGIILHHAAGYGGGRKAILPGVAKESSIYYNHRLIFEGNMAKPGVLNGNPLHEDALEACKFVKPDFLLNIVPDHEGNIAQAFAGHFHFAHKRGCELVDDLYKVKIQEQANLVIASCGGFPNDIDLRQSKKSLYNASFAVKRGGTIIFLAECSKGFTREGESFFEWATKYKTTDAIKEALLNNFQLGGCQVYRIREVLDRAQVHILTEIPDNIIKEIGLIPIVSLQEVIDSCIKEFGYDEKIIIMPRAALTLPEKSN